MSDEARPKPERPELVALVGAVDLIHRAMAEFRAGHDIAARHEIMQAYRLLDRAYSGDVA